MKLKLIFINIAVLLLLLSGTKGYCAADTPAFNDIKGSFAEESINLLAGQGIISGSGGEFRPEESISRRDFAVLIAKTLGVQPVFPPAPTFSDLPPGTVEAGYVEALAKVGIMKGSGGARFESEKPVLRQDAAVLLHQALGEGAVKLSLLERFIDRDRISPYAVESVAYVVGKGWMAGSDNLFYPLSELTRSEAAVLAGQLFKARRGQALTAFTEVSPQQSWLKTGETMPIEPRAVKIFPSFTTVYGMDNPAVCPVSVDGNSIYGKQPGKGAITVNAGYNHYNINTDVYTPQGMVKAPAGPAGKGNTGSAAGEDLESELKVNYTTKQHAPDSGFQLKEQKSYPGPEEGLASKNDTWTGFLRQQGRDITVDLKAARAVAGVSLEFMQNTGWGVFLPDYIKAEVSLDGASWYHLGYAYSRVSPSDTEERDINLTLAFKPVKARYIKISFPVDVWVFARHLSVKGGPEAVNPSVLALADKDSSFSGNYMNASDIRDILLVYSGDRSEEQTLDSGDFMPMLVFRDNKGVIAGRMFDTMLFLPYHELPCARDAWAAYAEDLFAPGRQLWALEEAMARVNEMTGQQGKEKVILSIPYPDASQNAFGVLEKGKEQLSFSENSAGREDALGDRFAAVRWYYSDLMDKWNKAGFKHLELAGMYWYGEVMDKTVSGETELVQNVARLVRGNSQSFFWCPYYGANGYEDWNAYGFTHAILQPNYYSKEEQQGDRMDSAAAVARRHGMGIEIELDEDIIYNRNSCDLFYKQLKKAHQLGFDGDMTNAYYAGNIKKSLVEAAQSREPQIRAIYEDIYRWISGTYK